MTIKKQEFYEGAALHLLIRSDLVKTIRYDAPFFWLNETLAAYLKYSTKGTSPWSFTFAPHEHGHLNRTSSQSRVFIGLICGSDGVAAIDSDEFMSIAPSRSRSIHLSCARLHGEQYEVSGPDGLLDRKIPPSRWRRIANEVTS